VDHDRKLLLSLIAVLVGFGTLMVYSASVTSRPTDFEQVYLSRHLIFLCLGLGGAMLASTFPTRFWFRWGPWLFGGTVLLLALVLVPGLGTRVKGAQRWFRLGPASFQPSELAKLTLPLYLTGLILRQRYQVESWWRGLCLPLLPLGLCLPLILLEPDLGTSLFLAVGAMIALFIGNWPLRNFALVGILAVPAVGGLILLKPYQVRRITGFVSTWTDWGSAPYQLKQSLVTLGAGGLWGAGLGRGFQKLSFLPEANTDFVFAVIGEELGLLGTLTIISLWGGVYVLGLRILSRVPRGSFEYIAGFTLLTQLVLQAALNMAVVTAMVPPKGIPHPLISYGGSNLVATLLGLGIFMGLTQEGQESSVPEEQPLTAFSEEAAPHP